MFSQFGWQAVWQAHESRQQQQPSPATWILSISSGYQHRVPAARSLIEINRTHSVGCAYMSTCELTFLATGQCRYQLTGASPPYPLKRMHACKWPSVADLCVVFVHVCPVGCICVGLRCTVYLPEIEQHVYWQVNVMQSALTNPYPRDLPVCRSVMTTASSMSPNVSKNARSDLSVVW